MMSRTKTLYIFKSKGRNRITYLNNESDAVSLSSGATGQLSFFGEFLGLG